MRSSKSRLRQQLQRVEEARSALVKTLLGEQGPLRKGSFVTVRRKCGKPNCRCVTGEGHRACYLSVKEGGRTRMVFVPAHLEGKVREEAEGYRSFRRGRAKLAKLARRSLELIDKLVRALETTEKLPSRKGKPQGPRGKSHQKKG